jgi:carbonic anhydrase
MKIAIVTMLLLIGEHLCTKTQTQTQNRMEMRSMSKLRNKKAQSLFSLYAEMGFNEESMRQTTTPTPPEPTDPNAPPQLLEDWLAISSTSFRDKRKFPPVILPDGREEIIKIDPEYFRINSSYDDSKKLEATSPPGERFFYFRLTNDHVYYSMNKEDISIMGTLPISNIEKIGKDKDANRFCVNIDDINRNEWKICSVSDEIRLKWMCEVKKHLQINDAECTNGIKALMNVGPPTIIEQKSMMPIILIPTPSKQCSQDWTYLNNGKDWECICIEGKEQSPVDLANPVESPVAPLFQYEEVLAKTELTTLDGQLKGDENLKIKYFKNALRIFHPNFGKIVTLDGAIYIAEELIFHTPSEHTLNGKRYDMEMQVVHYGQTRGDIAKQVVLSFLFEKTPGIYNKFIDDIDFFQLPNPLSVEKFIEKNLFIPKVFYTSTDENIPVMRPFSFYTYQGSLTFPPCTERTIHYVASQPIPIGTIPIQMMQEALKMPDMKDEKGNVFQSAEVNSNYRENQPLGDRTIFHFDHNKYCGDGSGADISGSNVGRGTKQQGHYEKVKTQTMETFYVGGKDPSALPGAILIPASEAGQ